MSGGVAYVWDLSGDFEKHCNLEMVELDRLGTRAQDELRNLVELHEKYTGSSAARRVLADWPEAAKQFVQVMPIEYKQVLATAREGKGESRDGTWTPPAMLPHTYEDNRGPSRPDRTR
jgi:glutamate synthase domain-containing protein 3